MPLTKPYFRCWRPILGREGRSNLYIYDPRYVENPGQHLRSVEILYNDLRAALDYIEPADRILISATRSIDADMYGN